MLSTASGTKHHAIHESPKVPSFRTPFSTSPANINIKQTRRDCRHCATLSWSARAVLYAVAIAILTTLQMVDARSVAANNGEAAAGTASVTDIVADELHQTVHLGEFY